MDVLVFLFAAPERQPATLHIIASHLVIILITESVASRYPCGSAAFNPFGTRDFRCQLFPCPESQALLIPLDVPEPGLPHPRNNPFPDAPAILFLGLARVVEELPA